jgi:hypothetical protein
MNYDKLIGRLETVYGTREPIAREAASALRQESESHTETAEMFRRVRDERDAALLECNEQARLLGMGSEREARLMAERDQIIERCKGIYSALESSLPLEDLSERQRGYEQGIEDYFQAIRAMKETKE